MEVHAGLKTLHFSLSFPTFISVLTFFWVVVFGVSHFCSSRCLRKLCDELTIYLGRFCFCVLTLKKPLFGFRGSVKSLRDLATCVEISTCPCLSPPLPVPLPLILHLFRKHHGRAAGLGGFETRDSRKRNALKSSSGTDFGGEGGGGGQDVACVVGFGAGREQVRRELGPDGCGASMRLRYLM